MDLASSDKETVKNAVMELESLGTPVIYLLEERLDTADDSSIRKNIAIVSGPYRR